MAQSICVDADVRKTSRSATEPTKKSAFDPAREMTRRIVSDKRKVYAIVGGGLAGFSAARTLRLEGFEGRVMLFSEEIDAPYERPPLSKDRLRGEISEERVLLTLPNYYEDHAIELQLAERVARIDPSLRTLELSGGNRVSYDKLLMATGAALRRIDVPGHYLDGVVYLRTLRDCETLRGLLQQHPRVLIVGTGFIGCEVAASARQLGCDVTLSGPELPLAHVLGKELSEIYSGYHRSKGVTLKTGVKTTAFSGAGRVEKALFSDGSTVNCDLVVVGIGVTPNIELVGGLVKTENGIVTDEFCRTDVESVFAAGDVANSWHPRLGSSARLEHFDNAQRQGEAAAKTMIGKPEGFDTVPFFYSDQYEFGLIYRGLARSWDKVVIRGKPETGSFSAFYLKDRRVLAICSLNRRAESMIAMRLLYHEVDDAMLMNESVDIDRITPKT
jgi:3-phenylpropionate/trans-cinnamate dioxygenase ferredoxin reductase subunit